MGGAEAYRTAQVAEIPDHVVVETKRPCAEIEALEEREGIKPLKNVLRLILFQIGGLCPERRDNAQRNVLCFGQDRQLAKASQLAGVKVLQARLDAGADGTVALRLIFRIESGKPPVLEPLLESGYGVA